MMNRKILQRVVAIVLAAMLGLSALGGVVMAFAEEAPDSMPEAITDSIVTVESDDDFAFVVLDKALETVTLNFDTLASLTFAPGEQRSLWLGWSSRYDSVITKLSDEQGASFDLLNFTFATKLETPGKMTMTTENAYLYSMDDGVLTKVESEYKDGLHSFTVNRLDCFLASDVPLKIN